MITVTPAYLISQSLLRIGGGIVTPDLSVRWGEAKSYLVYAVNYVMTGNYWAEVKAEGEKTINPLLYTTFDSIPVLYSSTNLRWYSDLPSSVITNPKGRALEMMTTAGAKLFPLDQGDDVLEEFYGPYKKWTSYQLEGPKRVWYYNLPPLVKLVRAKYVVRIDDVADTAEIVLPSDGEIQVIDMMVKFLLGELEQPKDEIEDGKQN